MSINKPGMRCFFLLSFFVVLIVAGCKKSNTQHDGGGGSGYYMDFKADGSAQDYRSNVLFTVTDETPGLVQGYGMSLVGTDSSTNFNGIIMDLTSTQPFAAGQTYNATALPNSDQLSAYLSFIAPTGLAYFSDSATVSVTLTSLSDSIVTGTFSGSVFNKDATDKPVYKLTEGSFRAKK